MAANAAEAAGGPTGPPLSSQMPVPSSPPALSPAATLPGTVVPRMLSRTEGADGASGAAPANRAAAGDSGTASAGEPERVPPVPAVALLPGGAARPEAACGEDRSSAAELPEGDVEKGGAPPAGTPAAAAAASM